MTAYIIRRVLWGVVLLVSLIVFFSIRLTATRC